MANLQQDFETWKPVLGYEGLYEASDWGRIKSLYSGNSYRGGILKPTKIRTGYLQVSLCKDKKAKNYNVHQLVVISFSDGLQDGMDLKHRDGNKENNALSNLERHTILQKENERWVPVFNYEGLYEVSDFGRLRILNYRNMGINKIKLSSNDKNGYLIVGLTKDGKVKMHKMHRLVAQAFIPNPDNLPQVNHAKGIKTDNRASQLEWCTCRQNIQHSFDTGLKTMTKGEDAPWSLLTNEQVRQIKSAVKNGEKQIRVSERLNIPYKTVNRIVRGWSWKSVA